MRELLQLVVPSKLDSVQIMDSSRRASSQASHSNQYQAMVSMFFRNSFINRCPSVFRPKTFNITNSRKYIFLQIWAINEIFSPGAYFILQNELITRLLLHYTVVKRSTVLLVSWEHRIPHPPHPTSLEMCTPPPQSSSASVLQYACRSLFCLGISERHSIRTLSFKTLTLLLAAFSLLSSSACLRLYSSICKNTLVKMKQSLLKKCVQHLNYDVTPWQ